MKKYFDKLYRNGLASFLETLEEVLEKEDKMFIVTANPETFMIAEANKQFKEVLESEWVQIVPDGIGVVKGAQFLGHSVRGRVTGVEIASNLLRFASQMGKSIYLYGAKLEVLNLLVERIQEDYPQLKIAGFQDGYQKNRQQVFEDILLKKPDIVLVALGIPAQELLIYQNYDKFSKGVFVGVGGSFDVLSGTKKRAPQFFIKLNLEWMYRIFIEPQRIGRFVSSNVKFVFKIINLKLCMRGKKNEN